MTETYQARSVLLPVRDMSAAVDFYTQVLGWTIKVRDGDRYAALDAGGMTVALAAPQDQPVEGERAINIKVADVETALHGLTEAGASVITPAVTGEHETRASVRSPDGNLLVVYQPAR